MHPDDHVLWRSGGGAAFFGFDIDPGPEPTIDLVQGQILRLGSVEFEVRYTPGHTKGHIVYLDRQRDWLFSGDTLFGAGCGKVFGGSNQDMIDSLEFLPVTLDGSPKGL